MKKKKIASGYATAYQELESILTRLEAGEIGIDDLEKEIARAQDLVVFCRTALRNSKIAIDRFEQHLNQQGKG